MIKSATLDLPLYVQEFLSMVPEYALFGIYPLWKGRVPPGWGEKNIKTYTSHYLVQAKKGKARFVVDGEEVETRRGDILFVSHGCSLGHYPDTDQPPDIVQVRFRLLSRSDRETHMPPPPGKGYALFQPAKIHRIGALFDQLYECWLQCPDPLAVKAAQDLLFGLLWACREAIITSDASQRDARMEEARLVLETCRDQNLSIADLAKQFHMSESHFSRLFKEQIGVPPKVFQLHTRMRWARRLLMEENLSVQQVASRLGYSDAFAFSRQFKKVWGISPSKI